MKENKRDLSENDLGLSHAQAVDLKDERSFFVSSLLEG